MKCQLATYEHSSNGMSVCVIPETDEEFQLLRGVWKHGNMRVVHPGSTSKYGCGFVIQWSIDDAKPE